MRKSIRNVIIILVLVIALLETKAEATLIYVGSWTLGDGPGWRDNPQVYTGQEAAALLFGGVAVDYSISTVSNDVDFINFSTWLDGHSDSHTYASSGSPAAQDFSFDLNDDGYRFPGGIGSAYSAYVADNYNILGQNDERYTNYAFYEDGQGAPIPEPATVALLGIGLAGLAGAEVRRRRKKKAVD